jgi:tRNA-dihydrouridine synthase B
VGNDVTSDSIEFFAIGPHRLPNRSLLAPMAGITDLPFRRMAARYGAGLVVSEMIAGEHLAEGDATALVRAEGEGTGLRVVQLAGCEARWLAEGARIAEAAGADVIDINMGCPAKQVTNGQQAGAALLRDVNHAVSLIEATIAAVRVPVTLKMRLGWDEHSIVAPELARRAEAAGIAMVTVHGRTRAQFYQGNADWRAIARVKEAVSIPVVANGDLTSFNEADAILSASGADAVMIGRAARGRPWFPGQVGAYLATGKAPADPSLDEQRNVLLELYEAWLHHSGRARGMREARKHVGWALEAAAASLGRTTAWAKGWRAALLSESDPALVLRGIGDAFDDLGWRSAA